MKDTHRTNFEAAIQQELLLENLCGCWPSHRTPCFGNLVDAIVSGEHITCTTATDLEYFYIKWQTDDHSLLGCVGEVSLLPFKRARTALLLSASGTYFMVRPSAATASVAAVHTQSAACDVLFSESLINSCFWTSRKFVLTCGSDVQAEVRPASAKYFSSMRMVASLEVSNFATLLVPSQRYNALSSSNLAILPGSLIHKACDQELARCENVLCQTLLAMFVAWESWDIADMTSNPSD